MSLQDLPRTARLVLSQEVDEAANLIAASIRSLEHLRLVDLDHAAVLALLAIGAEKMLKLSIGMRQLDDGGTWPSIRTMKQFGHGISDLDASVVNVYEARLTRTTAPGYLAQLIADWRGDTVGHAMLAAASTWGSSGRFNRLDHLAGSEPRLTTKQMWDEFEYDAMLGGPGLDFSDVTPGAYERNRAELNSRLLGSLKRWWELHARAWITGALGEDAKAFGHSLATATRTRS